MKEDNDSIGKFIKKLKYEELKLNVCYTFVTLLMTVLSWFKLSSFDDKPKPRPITTANKIHSSNPAKN